MDQGINKAPFLLFAFGVWPSTITLQSRSGWGSSLMSGELLRVTMRRWLFCHLLCFYSVKREWCLAKTAVWMTKRRHESPRTLRTLSNPPSFTCSGHVPQSGCPFVVVSPFIVGAFLWFVQNLYVCMYFLIFSLSDVGRLLKFFFL